MAKTVSEETKLSVCVDDLLIPKYNCRSSCCGSSVMNPTGINEDAGLISGLYQWVGDQVLL